MSAKIYAEGGGEGQILDTLFREAWTKFFAAAGLSGRMPRVVRGKGRSQTYDLFCRAVQVAKPGELPLLLVDAEDLVADGHNVWQHLKARDNWDKPVGASDDQAYLMVTVMETWFVADRHLLRTHFGSQLREGNLRAWPALERVAKQTIFAALDQATAGCKRAYAKGKVSFELLKQLNPSAVEAACPHARALLTKLRTL